MSYKSELKRAVARSLESGLMPSGFSVQTKNLNDKKLKDILSGLQGFFQHQINQGFVTRDQYRISCLRSAELTCELLRSVNCSCLLTFGNVLRDSKPFFKWNADNVIDEIRRSEGSAEKVELHAWVTVGDCIVDPTILPFAQPAEWLKPGFGNFIHCQDISMHKPFEYRPLLCGEAVLQSLMPG